MILGLVDEARAAGARQSAACEMIDLNERTVERWRAQGIGDDGRAGPKTTPSSKLSAADEQTVLNLVNEPRFRNLPPKQIVPILAEEGAYVASESTLYRVLHKHAQQKHRQASQPPRKRHRPTQLVATGPNQVWSWDITWMPSIVRGMFFRAYIVLDVWSRMIVAAEVFEQESAEHSCVLISRACIEFDIPAGQLSLHADNGGPMKAATMLATLQELGVASSFSRPSVSNDNPFSESAFRTMKYRPEYPDRPFGSLEEARTWLRNFVRWYNTVHRHSAIGFVTPEQRHRGEDVEVLERRRDTYTAARRRNPERWSGPSRPWERPSVVTLNPIPIQDIVRATA